MARTRSTKATTASAKIETAQESAAKYSLSPELETPPQVFILPRKASVQARIVSLPNPRYSKPTRYLSCPETGLYEFTKISAPKTSPRSWLIETRPGVQEKSEGDSEKLTALVTNGADLFIATPIDPLFLILPALTTTPSKPSEPQKRLFLSSDDHFDALNGSSSHLSEILRCPDTRKLLEERMAAACDTVDAGDEKMFRLSEAKLIQELVSKAKRLSKGSLPASMEDKFVRKALEAPVQTRRTAPTTGKIVATTSEVSTPQTDSSESLASTATTVDSAAGSFVSAASTAATSFTEENMEVVRSIEASPEVAGLQRLRVAFSFICSSYIPPGLASRLEEQLADTKVSSVNFQALDDYLSQLAKLRCEAAASRSMADYSQKRVLDEEEEEARAEKKRKVEEEKKRKANESRGVRELKKANTSGMKKLSEFFKKK